MPYFLSSRNSESQELMDNPNCDQITLYNTYKQFRKINTLIAQWKRVYRKELRPYLQTKPQGHILDIGFGGGDIPLKLAKWAGEDQLNIHITAIDTDERALNYVHQLQVPDNITFIQCSPSDLIKNGNQYDFVISNHLLHHIPSEKLHNILSKARQLSRYGVLFNDIRRSDIGYMLFNMFARPFFQNSYIVQDGLTSIKRSYTYEELRDVIPPGWKVNKLFPYRLLLNYYHE
ncbi:methyltransferase domain-containing protein [Aliifodinibius salicampi]|uniref:Methyltransferase domain-containing protein n=1 Tax=Fodinibius salicampi TaxID=1920655 RepID=A0ABT3Q057_9BACT|nr:methyltransferase domain-containing protein [Fodinibius salicampi]MCW9713465.1 methyltransferase domain-containing protein [Fodinibius salicampi]